MSDELAALVAVGACVLMLGGIAGIFLIISRTGRK
jgi:hypothetical protein